MSDLENKSRDNSHFLERYQEKTAKYYLKKCPKLYHICFDPVGSHKKARTGFGFLLGFLLGIFLYSFIISDLQLNKFISISCGAVLTLLLSIGCALSLQFRCICLLTIPGFLGRAGRSVLKALVLGYIIAGPIFNLTFNGKEVMRSFACTTQLTYNLTKTKFDLMFKPLHQALTGLKENSDEIKNTIGSVNELMEPIVKEVEGEEELNQLEQENDQLDELLDDTKRSDEIRDKSQRKMDDAEDDAEYYEAKYKEKIQARCEEQLSKGSGRCRDMFSGAYNNCYKTVTWAVGWLLCWPMKLTFVCNLVQALGGNRICNPDGKIDVGLGEGYVTLKETRDQLSKSLKDAKVKYNVDPKPIVAGVDAAKAAAGVMRDLEARKRFFDSIIALIKRCLSLIFLKIIINASRYHSNYLRDIEYDNVYVTPYFRRIDARRKVRGSLTLLPLKKLERTKLVDPYGLHQSKNERKNIFGQTAKLLLEIITATTFILMDRMLFEVLDIVRRHARLEITQAGHHDLSLEIKGVGLVAALVRSLVRGFNVKRHIKTIVTNEACLPQAQRLPTSILLKIYGGYLAVWLMLLLQAHSQRLRFVLAAFFYRKREKRRVLYLYNETLRRRVGFLKFARARVVSLARAHKLHPVPRPWLAIRVHYPHLFGWLQRFSCARRSCVLCSDVEPRRAKDEYQECSNCSVVYCPECWKDIGRECLGCKEEAVAGEESSAEEPLDADD